MKTIMKIEDLKDVQSLSDFLSGSQAILFEVASRKSDRYRFIEVVLRKTRYASLKRADKGVVRAFLLKVTGYSRAQITRLLKEYTKHGKIEFKPSTTNGFKSKYERSDISLLAEMDKRYDCLSGGTTKKLCERAYELFGDTRFIRLKDISVAQIYRYRKTKFYRQRNLTFTKTKPIISKIGKRQKPFTNGEAGYIRIDTVHQGDQDKVKGVYHINAVDEETQYQVIMSVSAISEQFLLPVLKVMLDTFPFVLKGFHSDNGSEYINKYVAKLLNKLHVEFTKSRARKSNDNALVESKNGSVIRKLFGYHHIPQKYASQLNEFHQLYLMDYINFHRPCYFAEIVELPNGKQKRKYPYKKMMTPYEKLKSLPDNKQNLKDGIIFDELDQQAACVSDNEAKDQLDLALKALMYKILEAEK